LRIAIEEIRQAIQKGETIAVDCEGVELSRFGSVTLVNIAVRGQVYLIDVLIIGSAAYDRGLRSILEDKSIQKLMFLSVLLQSLFYQTRTVLDNV
jgi:exonuclease 3'-5' domain-containing protein 1